jgi:RNA polymerase sigma factor (sigma-70 family)
MTADERSRLSAALSALAANRQDQKAWTELVRLTFPIALATTNRLLHGALDLSRDAAWDAFARLARYTNFSRFKRGDADAFIAYLKTVVRRTAYDVLKALAKRAPELQVDVAALEAQMESDDASPEEVRTAEELRSDIEARLSEEERRLLQLTLDGRTPAEIGALLSISPNAVSVRLHRLRAKIRDYLNARKAKPS